MAEPPRDEQPVPMIAGKHFLPFHTPAECVAACERLLRDRELAQSMRQMNHDYYVSELEPTAHLRRVLERHGEVSILTAESAERRRE
jgi:hypothetical protein